MKKNSELILLILFIVGLFFTVTAEKPRLVGGSGLKKSQKTKEKIGFGSGNTSSGFRGSGNAAALIKELQRDSNKTVTKLPKKKTRVPVRKYKRDLSFKGGLAYYKDDVSPYKGNAYSADGKVLYYYDYGVLSYKVTFNQKNIMVRKEVYYDNGNPKLIENYKNKKLHGVQAVYASDGSIKSMNLFQNGVRTYSSKKFLPFQ